MNHLLGSGFHKRPHCHGNLNLNWGQEAAGRTQTGLWSEAEWEQHLLHETYLLGLGVHCRTRSGIRLRVVGTSRRTLQWWQASS